VLEGEICSLCRKPLSEAGPIVKRAGMRGGCVFICRTCAELANGGSSGRLFLVIRASALPLSAELGKLFDEIGKLFDVVGKLKPRKQFRIRSYMIGVVLLAGLLAVPLRDIPLMLILALPGLATAGEWWLWCHGYRRLALCLVGFPVGFCVVDGTLVLTPYPFTFLSPSAIRLLGAIWTWVLLYNVFSGVRRWKTVRLTESATSE